jgi:hypothetical protein
LLDYGNDTNLPQALEQVSENDEKQKQKATSGEISMKSKAFWSRAFLRTVMDEELSPHGVLNHGLP